MILKNPIFILRLFTVALALAGPANASSEEPANTQQYTLDNGLKLIIREDHRAPVVVSQVWYKVGASYEPIGKTGISHVLEHMMFKGTEKISKNTFSEVIEEYGGEQNAFTSYDYTGYYQVLESSRIALSLELESDRMENLLFDDEEFNKEIEVVKEERRLRIEDKPNAIAYERFMAAAHTANPYHSPIIGWMHDLDNITVNDLKDWYSKWYHPNNATLVVVGDVDSNKVLELAKQYFGAIPKGVVPQYSSIKEISGLGEKRTQINIPAQVPAIYMGFNTPSINTAENESDAFALYVLASILDGGFSARIEKKIIRELKIASGAGAGYSPFSLHDTLFTFSATPAAGHTTEEVEAAFWDEIKLIQSEPPSEQEMNRVTAQLSSNLIFSKDSISAQANMIGKLESIGQSWEITENELELIRAITPEQVTDVATKYLIRDRLTVTTLKPKQDIAPKKEDKDYE